jgi:hypothetical protein
LIVAVYCSRIDVQSIARMMSAQPQSGIGFTGLPRLRPRKNARPEFQAVLDTNGRGDDNPLREDGLVEDAFM